MTQRENPQGYRFMHAGHASTEHGLGPGQIKLLSSKDLTIRPGWLLQTEVHQIDRDTSLLAFFYVGSF